MSLAVTAITAVTTLTPEGMVDTTADAGNGAEQARPRISVRGIPDLSPPVIDSRTAVLREPSPFIQGSLAVDFSADCDAAQDARDPQDLQDREYFGPQRTLSGDLPEPQAWVRGMAQALVEVMSGARPAPQVMRWTTAEVYSVVARRGAVSGRCAIVARRALVRRVRICEPADGVVEACAVVVDNGRVRVLAMRLTGVDGRWVISELQVG
jgi:hypothetical protein